MSSKAIADLLVLPADVAILARANQLAPVALGGFSLAVTGPTRGYSQAAMDEGLLQRYRALVGSGELQNDDAQAGAAARLDALQLALQTWRRRKTGPLSIFSRRPGAPPRGLYIHGGVGRGKTMLMDLFFESVDMKRKRRLHFHEFMAEAHDMIAIARQTHDGDPIGQVGQRITSAASLMCFDEMHVTDITDAMIVGRLFKAMFEAGVVVVATSNMAPSDLYANGLNRQLFLPFIDLINERMETLELTAAKDYRLDKLAGKALYFMPADGRARAEMDRIWKSLTGAGPVAAMDLEVKRRLVHVPCAAMGSARFSFSDLCSTPLGTLDYLAIARTFHTVMIDDIPVLGPQRRNEARRFINLIDTLYDGRVSLIASADAEPAHLYVAGDGADLFARTASRLIEMRSAAYLADRAGRFAHNPPQQL